MRKVKEWLTTILIIAVVLAFSFMVFFYYDQYFGGGLVEKIVEQHSAGEEQQEEPPQPERLTVNPDYDGTNGEYHYVEGNNGYDVVWTIRQTIDYRYYSNSGDAIAEIETVSKDSSGKMLSSSHHRDQVRKPDTSVAKDVVVRSYSYSESAITCSMTTTSYAADGSEISSTTTESSRPR